MTDFWRFLTHVAVYVLVAVAFGALVLGTLAYQPAFLESKSAPENISQIRQRYLSEQLALHLAEHEINPMKTLEALLETAPNTAVRSAFEGTKEVLGSYDADTMAMLQQLEQVHALIESHNLAAPAPSSAASSYPEITYDDANKDYYYEFGEYLAGECTVCHSISYDFTGIPIIIGLDVSYFVGRMKDYANGTLENEAMQSVAVNLDDEMLLSLAIFFASQDP